MGPPFCTREEFRVKWEEHPTIRQIDSLLHEAIALRMFLSNQCVLQVAVIVPGLHEYGDIHVEGRAAGQAAGNSFE